MSEDEEKSYYNDYDFSEVIKKYCRLRGIRGSFPVHLSAKINFKEGAIKNWLKGGTPSVPAYFELIELFGEDFETDCKKVSGIEVKKPIRKNENRDTVQEALGRLISAISSLYNNESPYKYQINARRQEISITIKDTIEKLEAYDAHLEELISYDRGR